MLLLLAGDEGGTAGADLDRVAQVFTRLVHRRFGLVYYPLWVLRYLYRDRAFQVVVDGYTGKVLYGKAPGSTLYRALVLIGGMIAGAFLSIDVSSAFFTMAFGMEGDGDGVFALFAHIGAGIRFALLERGAVAAARLTGVLLLTVGAIVSLLIPPIIAGAFFPIDLPQAWIDYLRFYDVDFQPW